MGKLYLGTEAVTPAIYSGAIPGKPLDPAQVYHDTRPSDWLPMPTPENNEIYLLVEVPKPMQEKDPGVPLTFMCYTSAGQYRVELGTVTNGEFVADSTYTTLVNSNTAYAEYLYYADWTTNSMDDGTHQVMVKISAVSGNITFFDHTATPAGSIKHGYRNTLEARGHCELATKFSFAATGGTANAATSMKFCSLEGPNRITNFSSMFVACYSLTAILALDTSSGTNFSSMFGSCRSLIAIPVLDTSSGIDFSGMFGGCYSLTTIPLLNTSSGNNFSSMFNNCYSFATIPALDTSSGTNFQSMFGGCYSLATIPALDVSSGINFQNMFNNCYSFATIPALDTSSGTNFQSMFGGCYSLATIPLLDTSSGTNFQSMFSACYSLATIPALDTSSGNDFSTMFNNCRSLTTIPLLNTSSGTNFQGMFGGCTSLITIPLLNTSLGTNFSSMFSNCYSLTTIPLLNTSSGNNFSSMFSGCYSLAAIPALDTSLGTNFSSMFDGCRSLTAIPALNTSSGINFQRIFNSCENLLYANLVGYDFTGITSSNYSPTILIKSGSIVKIDNKFQMSTGGFSSAVLAPASVTPTFPAYVLIEDESAMIPLGANATTVFTSTNGIYVVVPDSMYDTYAADTRWATLGTRLKRRSEVTLPDWYTN